MATTREHYDVVIVGAGYWGLCAAHTFLSVDPNVSLLVLDSKSSVGGVWSLDQLYPDLRANNLQGYYEFSDFPMLGSGLAVKPRSILTGQVLHEYLHSYAERFDLLPRIRLGTKVLRATEQGSEIEDAWILELASSEGTGGATSITSSKLVVATGQATTPIKPSFKGLASFAKPVLHSVDLGKTGPALIQDAALQEITVIGGSKSAHDAVYMFATAGKHVTWLIHGTDHGRGAMPMSKPYTQIGPWSVWLEGLLMTRPLSWFGAAPWSDGDGFGWIRWFLHRTQLGNRLVRGYFASMSGGSIQLSGILDDEKTKALVPDKTLLWYGTQANLLNYDQDFYQLIREKEVTIIRGNIDHLDTNAIYVDQQAIETDALICAIGYDYTATIPLEPSSRRLPWGCPVDQSQDAIHPALDARADQELFARFPILHTSPVQPERQPKQTSWRLWRFIAPPSQVPHGTKRNLAFLNTITCYQTTIKAELTSLWAYAYLYDRLTVKTPSEDDARYEATLWSRFGKWRAPYGMQGKIADFLLDAMPYHDLLLRDLGLCSWRKGWGWFGEVFGGWYELSDYSGLVAEWMQSQEETTARARKNR